MQSGVLGNIVAIMGSAAFHKPDTGYFDGPHAWRREPGGGPILVNMIHEVDNLRFASGALASFLLCDTAASPRNWEQTSGENAAFVHYDDEDAYSVMGTNGSRGVPTMRLRYYDRPEGRSWSRPFVSESRPVGRADPLALQIEHFAAVIRGDARPLVSGRDGLQNLRIVDAIHRAAASGTTIAVPTD